MSITVQYGFGTNSAHTETQKYLTHYLLEKNAISNILLVRYDYDDDHMTVKHILVSNLNTRQKNRTLFVTKTMKF